ncbi:transcription factor SPEECHLESS-like isoform X2 [Salvia splendens]|uniref:transcription factor SPEECHLESS-like isoform X2 n=1 Tax=Salvia splendens TaxID=180675 RepID=UPI001C271390|nr:transcription factor SPEECHLESS-like isoform X2 [Salvia splendens]
MKSMDAETLSGFFEETTNFSSSDDIFCILEAWEYNNLTTSPAGDDTFEFQNSALKKSQLAEDAAASQACKRQKLSTVEEGQNKSHITVERNRRKQMNDHLSVLRSLMPCFYVKRGDQASIIGGVVDYINELQQVLQSLEAKKQRKAAYNEVLSPRIVSSPRPSPLSPRTPQPSSPYKPWMHPLPSPVDPSPCNSSTSSSINDAVNELVATSKSPVAQVEVKFSGPNLLLKTVSHRLPGQVLKIISALEELALEILHVSISTVDETMLNSFTIKIGIQCQLSAEELAEQIQQTFC